MAACTLLVPTVRRQKLTFSLPKASWQRNTFNFYQVNTEMMLIKMMAALLPPTNALRSKRQSDEITEVYTSEDNQEDIASNIYGGRASRIGLAPLTRSWGMVEGTWVVEQLPLHSRKLCPSSIPAFPLLSWAWGEISWQSKKNGVSCPKPSIRQ